MVVVVVSVSVVVAVVVAVVAVIVVVATIILWKKNFYLYNLNGPSMPRNALGFCIVSGNFSNQTDGADPDFEKENVMPWGCKCSYLGSEVVQMYDTSEEKRPSKILQTSQVSPAGVEP